MPTTAASGKKNVTLYVNGKYPYSGKQLKDAIDKLFPVIWNELSGSKQQKIMDQYAAEIDMLDFER